MKSSLRAIFITKIYKISKNVELGKFKTKKSFFEDIEFFLF